MINTKKLRNQASLAHKELCKICENHKAFRMSIPVQETDTDEVIGVAIDSISDLCDTIDKLKEALEFYAGKNYPMWVERTEQVDLSKTSAVFNGRTDTVEVKGVYPTGRAQVDRGKKAIGVLRECFE